MSEVVLESVLVCPVCGFAKRETMPTEACQFFYECAGCKTLLRPAPGDCCVFCSYGSVKCPPMQGENCPLWRSLAALIFVCVELLSSFAADPKSSTEKEPEYTNHLINEKSPYLLQHAHNPVDWYPWGEEAFAKARKENKPIFLSVGYSTCHWCHVMERESYSDPEIAGINERQLCQRQSGPRRTS
jgi:hypothetical protein